jgi:tetratricopeptide (TPR) repeat protein
MFCHQCGVQLPEEARFCSNCGAKVVHDEDLTIENNPEVQSHEEEIEIEQDRISESQHEYRMIRKLLPIVIPVSSFVLVTIGVSSYYFYEDRVNAHVLSLKNKAEELALKGEYEKAETKLNKAIKMRPEYVVLQKNIKAVQLAHDFEKSLEQVTEKIKKKQFDEAAKDLASLKEKVNVENGPLFAPFHKLIAEKEITITVGKIKQEIDQLHTVDQLVEKLNVVSSLSTEEAKAVKEQIINKIVQISSDEAEKELQNKQFSDALAVLDKGLQYAVNDKKLLTFKEKVKQEQEVFERAEQERLEKAMEAAAQEDLKNQTAAVEVSTLDAQVDDYGDLYIYGNIKNVATTVIYSVTIYYSITDMNGNYIDEGFTTVYPYHLNPGDSGSFEDIYYGVNQDVNVEITNITWYLD